MFKSVIDDLFPNVSIKETTHDWLKKAYKQRCIENDYQPVESQYRKLVEINDMSGYRQGIMLVGNPYTGKSFLLKTLTDAIIAKNNLSNGDIDLGMSNLRNFQ